MIDAVARIDDPRLAEYAHLGDHAWLTARGIFVAEGRLVVRRLFASERYTVRSLLVTPSALESLSDVPIASVPVYLAEQSLLNTLTGFNFHRGCLALADRPARAPLAVDASTSFVALERIGNPDNVGGLFRVAAAFGGGILLSPGSADPYYRKAIRTSMGAVLSVPFEVVDPWPAGLARFADAGFRIVAMTPRADAHAVGDVRLEPGRRIVLVVGAEGPGLSDAALAAADVRVRIPMAPGVDSLNVTVAAGIALSHLGFPSQR